MPIAQPLAAVPPYGCGMPLAGASAHAQKIRFWSVHPDGGKLCFGQAELCL